MLLLDVDHFKDINDTLGHAVGDAVISRLGETFSSRLRTMDVVARLGGDEFAVLLRRVDAGRRVRRWRAACASWRRSASPTSPLEGVDAVTLSVGVATFGNGEEVPTPDDLLSRADHAMYDAKRAGGNRVSGGVPA